MALKEAEAVGAAGDGILQFHAGERVEVGNRLVGIEAIRLQTQVHPD